MLIALDFFDENDDQFDLEAGVLKHVASILNDILPKEESFLGRYGSDEFLVVLPDVHEEEAREVIPYLNKMIRKSPFKYQNTVILIQPIIGVGSLTESMERPQELLDEATSELCRMKMMRLMSGI
jgi:diguanylate cyclase (GGDEF)-like protein